MSQDLVAAVSGIGADPNALIERHRSAAEGMDAQRLDVAPSGGGAAIQVRAFEPAEAPSAMNLQSLAGQFSEGLKHGFYANDINHLMATLKDSRDPMSGVTVGDVTVELLNVQAKVGIADAFSKVSSKLSEGLQTLVVKQG